MQERAFVSCMSTAALFCTLHVVGLDGSIFLPRPIDYNMVSLLFIDFRPCPSSHCLSHLLRPFALSPDIIDDTASG